MRTAGAVTLIVIVTVVVTGCGFKTNPRPASATVPGEVGLVSAHAYPERVVLTWDIPTVNVDGSPIKDLSGFKVYRSSQKVGEECDNCEYTENVYGNIDIQHPVNAAISRGEVVFTDKGVKPGTIYHYSVTSYNLRGRESARGQAVAVVFDEPPAAPTGVRSSSDARGIVLRWDQPPERSDVRGFRIYRGDTARLDDMKPVGHTQRSETYFVDRDLEKGKTYFYAVRSVKLNRGISLESPPSEPVNDTMRKSDVEPPGKVNTSSTSEGIRVSWDPVGPRDGETRYNVYRSESARVFSRINDEPVRGAWFMDKSVVRGGTYIYGVTAFPEGKAGEESSRTTSEPVKYNP